MKRKILISAIILICSTGLFSQTDHVAVSIMDKFSERALNSPSVSMTFHLLIEDSVEDTNMESEGEIVIKGNKYKLTVPENIIWFDGEAIYTLVPEVEELTITEPNPEDEAFLSSPSLLFTLYREGYKVRLVGESPEGSIIDLYPEDVSADFSRIRLYISKSYDLLSAEYRRKDGITMTIKVEDYDLKKKFKDMHFNFDSKKYSDVDIIDMRF